MPNKTTSKPAATAEVRLPISPQEIALRTYTDLVNDVVREGGEPTVERMRDIVVTTVEAACRAQRYGCAVLMEVLGERSPDIEYRRVCGELSAILKGEKKPQILREENKPFIAVVSR